MNGWVGRVLAGATCGALSCAGSHTATSAWPVMGSIAQARARAPDRAQALRAVEVAREVFARVDASMSNWSASSELSSLNRRAGREPYVVRDRALRDCVAASLDAARWTEGAFDPTVGPLVTLWGFRPHRPRVPAEIEIAATLARVGARRVHFDAASGTVRFDVEGMELDLGGIAKGCALDLARDAIRIAAPAAREVYLDLGGGIATIGAPESGPWSIAIADPARGGHERVLATVKLPADATVATSSNAENAFEAGGRRYGHLLDPHTGSPAASDVLQATAIHPSATTSDVLSTALLVAGSARAGTILGRAPRAEAILLVREAGGVALVASASLRGRIETLAPSEFGPWRGEPRFTLPAATIPASAP